MGRCCEAGFNGSCAGTVRAFACSAAVGVGLSATLCVSRAGVGVGAAPVGVGSMTGIGITGGAVAVEDGAAAGGSSAGTVPDVDGGAAPLCVSLVRAGDGSLSPSVTKRSLFLRFQNSAMNRFDTFMNQVGFVSERL